MDYKFFKKILEEDIQKGLNKELKDNLAISTHYRLNEEIDTLILPKEINGVLVSPVIPINWLYDCYKAGQPYEEILQHCLDVFHGTETYENANLSFGEVNSDYIVNQVMLQEYRNVGINIVHRRRNKKLLEQCPHINIHDLSVIFRVRLDENRSVILKNNLFEKFTISKEELFETIKKNARDDYEIIPMYDIICAMAEKKGVNIPPDLLLGADDPEIYVVSNKNRCYGAGAMAIPEILDMGCAALNTDSVYILPSSIHEIILLKKEDADSFAGLNCAQDLIEMVKEVNKTAVLPEDVLSDSVYTYNTSDKQLLRVEDLSKVHSKKNEQRNR